MTDNGAPTPADDHTESHDQTVPEAWSKFMREGWDDREVEVPEHPITPWAAARRERLSGIFPGERLVVPAGTYKVRANDTDYRFRADTAHVHLTGNQTSDAVVVIEPDGTSVLYARRAAAATPTSSSATVSTARSGPVRVPRPVSSPTRWASRYATSTSSSPTSPAAPRPAYSAESLPTSTSWSPRPRPPATRSSPRRSPSCA